MWQSYLPFALFLVPACALAFYTLIYRHIESRKLIKAWAYGQEITLVSCRWQLKPYDYWPLSLSMMTFPIKVADQIKRERFGWILVRDVWYKDRIDVIWDDELPPH